uniref:Cyclin N-terminal domain-containing protein n=1 Tax=Plectus sambesii TaxID=2011161 RepID=A0A914W8V1_9BILA
MADKTGQQEEPVKAKPQKLSSFGLPRLYSRVDISADKWLLPIEKMSNPPSLADGLDAEAEKELRFLGCELIQSAAILLRLPQVAAATAQILYQRYFYQKSFVRNNFEHTAMACVLMASKIEEAPRRPRDITNVFHRLKQINRNKSHHRDKKLQPMMLDQHYIALKNQVIKAERRVLNVLGFVVHVKHPHKLIYAYLHALQCTGNTQLLKTAWAYMNDGLRTDIFMQYAAETIACACIFLAARTVEPPVSLPQEPFPWFELFDASDRDVQDIALILTQLYARKRVSSTNFLKLENQIAGLREKIPGLAGNKVSKFAQPSNDDSANNTPSKDHKSRSTNRDSSPNGKDRRSQNGKVEGKRKGSRSRSRESSRHRNIPKRYKSPSRDKDRRRSDKMLIDKRGGSRNDLSRSRDRSPRRDRDDKDRQRRSDSKERGRDRNKLDRRAREKEVIQTLGKRRRDSSSPESRSRKNKR